MNCDDANSNYYLQQLSTECLSQFAYYIESEGEAAIIDPLRHSEQYLTLLEQRKAKLKYIILTHFHADFVSGHMTLLSKTGARIVMGPQAEPEFPATIAKDGESFPLGSCEIKVVHTPGHTLESSCYILRSKGKDVAVFTGDTLFLGDVGRPDLSVDPTVQREDLAGLLFESIQKLKQLDNDLAVYPGHGAGSPCGKNIQGGSCCTIGKQKETNYALKINDRQEFIASVCKNVPQAPKYFFHDAKMNRSGKITDADETLQKSYHELSQEQFKSLMHNPDYIVLDTTDFADFKAGHIPGTVSVPLSIKFAIFAATIVNNKHVLIVAEPGKERESILRLSRTGVDTVVGFLKGGVGAWPDQLSTTAKIGPQEFADLMKTDTALILDVREKGELVDAKLPDVTHISLNVLAERYMDLAKDKVIYTLCKTGGRSMIAHSFLQSKGFKAVNIEQGMTGLEKTDITVHRDNHHL